MFRVFDADRDDFVELPEPIPKDDPRYAGLQRQSKDAMSEAWRREKERTPE